MPTPDFLLVSRLKSPSSVVVEDASRPVSPGEAPKGQGDYLTSGAPKDPLEVQVQVHPLHKHTTAGVDLAAQSPSSLVSYSLGKPLDSSWAKPLTLLGLPFPTLVPINSCLVFGAPDATPARLLPYVRKYRRHSLVGL